MRAPAVASRAIGLRVAAVAKRSTAAGFGLTEPGLAGKPGALPRNAALQADLGYPFASELGVLSPPCGAG
jgi:hypothetical protein